VNAGTNVCPSCRGWKSARAAVCWRCYPTTRVALALRSRPDVVAPIRTLDAHHAGRSDWRPAHLPPACGTCRGFGYVQGDRGGGTVGYRRDHVRWREQRRSDPAGGWHACPDCAGHPGSVMTHEAWTDHRKGE